MQLDISKIELLFVYVVYVCVLPELKLSSAFSEPAWAATARTETRKHLKD